MKKRWFLPAAAMLIAAAVAISGVALRRADRAENVLEEVCRAALWESAEEMQALALSLEKVAVSADPGQEAALLAGVSRSASEVGRSLSLLPLSHEAMSPTLKFANQLADYASSLIAQAAERGLTQAEREQLRSHLALCTQLASQLALVREDAERTGFASLASADFYAPADADARPLEILADKDHGMQYPTLIYDGPFSDARHAGQPLGLPEGNVSQEEALVAARAFVGEERVRAVSPAPDAGGTIPAWGVTVFTDDLQLNLEITRQGGRVLWMMPETAAFQQLQSIAVCRTAAAEFLSSHGFGAMEATHHQVYDGLCVLNFAAVQDGVRLYPDLVKVQVRMDTAEVVGLEAHNYWMNHRPRTLAEPSLPKEAAQALLAPGLSVSQTRLCLVPLHAQERLCWEFDASLGDGRYLVYLDAETGDQVQLLKVIPLSQGALTS